MLQKLVFSFILAQSLTAGYSQNCNCDSTFFTVKSLVENNYAGWFDKTSAFDQSAFTALTKKTEKECSSIASDSLCADAIKKWVMYFDDGHLKLRYFSASGKAGVNKQDNPVAVRKSTLTADQIAAYIKAGKISDKIEGLWENQTYKIGIVRSKLKRNTFDGVVIQSKNENWQAGEIKLTITQSSSSGYLVSFISGDKTVITSKTGKLTANILDASPMYLSKTSPTPPVVINLEDYELENDPDYPKLRFPGNNLAVFSFPNFYSQNYEVVQELLRKNEKKLAVTKYWIIDLRANEGGDVAVGKLLLPYIYTKPVIDFNTKARLTKDNYENFFNSYIKETYDSWDEATRKQYDTRADITRSHFGEFRNIYEDNKIADTITYNEIKPFPVKVGIVIDNNTYSSGELFTLLARYSDKVMIYGQHSAGSIDYGNILTYKTNCSSIRLTLPFDRYNWLDYGVSIDRDKIRPDILIPATTKDWIKFTFADMQKRNKVNGGQ